MAVQYPTQEDQERRRQDESPLTSNMPTTTRADRMQAQMNQPVIGPRGVVTSAGAPSAPKVPGIADGFAGGAKIITGGTALPFAVGIDAARSGIASLVGGDPNTLPGGRSRYADSASATLSQGIDQASAASDRLKAGTREALGVQLARDDIAEGLPVAPARTAVATPSAQPASIADEAATPGAPAGNGYTQVGNGIAMRIGADGTPEFTNDAAALSGAGTMPAGGFPAPAAGRSAPGSMVAPDGARTLASGSNYQTDAEAFARQGSVANIGNGTGGGLSVGRAGDAAMALGRFERANQEREKMVQISRRGQIGEGGGRVTIVRDSSRSPSIADFMNARLDARQAQTNLQNQQAQQGILSGMDGRLTNQLNRQRTQQELNIGGIQLAERQRLDGLAAQMADISLSQDQREAARSAYASLSTPAKDRYILQDTVIASDPITGPKYGKVAIDVLTGRPVAGGSSAPGRTSVTRAEVEKTAKDEGMTVEQVSKMLRDRGITVE